MNWFKLECTTRAFVTALQLTVRYEMSVIIIITLANTVQTSVVETIRKPPLVKAQTAFKNKKCGEKRFSIWRMRHDHDIDFAR